uniref:Uncharacterized protein n=1 Tax=Trichogramma kaykai TaxID=54128 RepID=A0ABD2WC00_9HYME
MLTPSTKKKSEISSVGLPLGVNAESIIVNDENWQCIVVMLVEARVSLINIQTSNCFFMPSHMEVQLFFDHLNDSKLLNDVIIRTFCPPVDCLDLYDRLSYVLYDIYESLQAHQEYLARMRVFDVEEEKRGEMYLRYELATSWLPEELAVVSLLLEKMLQLVEEEVTDDDGYDDKEAGGPSESFSNSCSETSTLLNTANSDPLDRIELKLYLLNLKYELAQPRANETSLDEFRLILHGDELWLNACRANDALLLPASNSKRCQAESLKVAPQPQPLDPRITTAWKDNDEEVRNCQYQMEDIFQYCTEQGMSRSDGLHALNLLAIKKMYAMRRKKNSQNSKQNSMPSLDKTSSKKPLEKAPSYSLTNTSKAKKPSGSQQNNLLNQSLYEEDYPAIFGLIDAREIFDVSDSEDGDVCGSSNDGRCPAAPFDGIEDVECLGYAAFLQIVRDCFRRVDQRNHSDSFVLVEHFVPTDSILLLFVDQDDDYGQELESSDTCVLRTPVCLHDFSDYVEDEELDWLESRRKSNDGNKLAQRLRQVMKQTDVQRPTINDADFYLPGSLKACELQILRDAECNAPGNSRCSSKVNAHALAGISDGTRTMSCCQWDESVQRQDSVDADFVWVEARGYAEHPSYATVERGYSTMILFRVSLSNLRVEFGLDGNVTLTNDDGGSKIMLNESSVLLTRQACHSCGACSSRLTFHLAEAIPEDHPAATLLTCRDSLARQSFGLSRRDLRFETSSEEKAKGADEPLTRKCDCGREEAEGKKAAASASIKKNRKCRLFSLTRNQEAYEYHHRSVWLDHLENKMLPKGEKEEPTASLIVEGQRRIALVPFANYRPAWLLDYKLVSGSKKKEVKTGKKRPMTCEGQEYWEKRVRDWARGRGTTINWDSYEAGRRVNFDT